MLVNNKEHSWFSTKWHLCILLLNKIKKRISPQALRSKVHRRNMKGVGKCVEISATLFLSRDENKRRGQ